MSSNRSEEDDAIPQVCCLHKFLCSWCCPPWPRKFVHKRFFTPPKTSYSLVGDAEGNRFTLVPVQKPLGTFCELWRDKMDCFFAVTSRRNRIACVFFNPVEEARYTILYSHGNTSDLGDELIFCMRLGVLADCNVFSYDYTGYGASSGEPSEKDMFADIDCALDTLKTRYGVLEERVILYGRGLGTVPTLEVASRRRIAGVVLLSPLTSSKKVVYPGVRRPFWDDKLPSIDRVKKITAPILVIHGTLDRVIDFCHGVSVFTKCRDNVQPLWIEGAGHNDIQYNLKFMEGFRRFAVKELKTSSSRESLDEKLEQLRKLNL